MTRIQIVKRLLEEGFHSQGGTKHEKFVHPDGRRTVIPSHHGDFPIGTVKAIEKQTKVKL